jgi:hypothetical protein
MLVLNVLQGRTAATAAFSKTAGLSIQQASHQTKFHQSLMAPLAMTIQNAMRHQLLTSS